MIERVPVLYNLFNSLWMFALFFLIIYIPTAVILGYWHRRKQLRIEAALTYYENPVGAKVIRALLDVMTGKAKPEEVEEVRTMLLNIESGWKRKASE